MKKTGKYIAGMLLAMGMSLAGAVSGFAAPDPGTDLNVENVRWDGDSGSGTWTDNTSARYYHCFSGIKFNITISSGRICCVSARSSPIIKIFSDSSTSLAGRSLSTRIGISYSLFIFIEYIFYVTRQLPFFCTDQENPLLKE